MFKSSDINKAFSLAKLNKGLSQINELFSLQQLSGIASKASLVLHELQKERGYSSWYLGDKGKSLRKLNAQIKRTNLKIMEFQSYLSSMNINSFNKDIKNIIGELSDKIKNIEEARFIIVSLKTSIDNSISYYSELISFFIRLIKVLTKFNINSEINQNIKAYISLLELKEQIGQERATLAGTFSENKFNSQRFDFFLQIIDKQEKLRKTFFNKASQEQIKFYNTKIEEKILYKIEDFRKLALKNISNSNFEVSTASWFKVITKKIELLKEIEDKIASDLNITLNKVKLNSQSQTKDLIFRL